MTALLWMALGAALVVGLGLIAAALLRRSSAATRHWVIATALVGAALLPAARAVVPGWTLSLPGLRPVERATVVVPVATESSVDLSVEVVAPARSRPAATLSLSSALLWVWGGGAAAGLLVVLAGFARLRHLARHAEPVSDPRLLAAADEALTRQRLQRRLRMLYSARSAGVVTWGLRRPTVLLPREARHWSDDRMRVVMFHEVAHVGRGDWPLHVLAALMCCVHWYNPLFWMAQRRLRHESERACDDAVIRVGVAATDYASQLLAVAEEAGRGRSLWSPASAIAHSSTLEERIHAMLNAGLDRAPLRGWKRSLTLLLMLLLTLIVAGIGGSRVTVVSAAAAPAGQAPSSSSIAVAFYDQHSGVLPDVEVTLTHEGTQAVVSGRSDANGAVGFSDLPAGNYTLLARLPGFAPVTTPVSLTAGAETRRNVMLPLGTVQETITVRSGGSTDAQLTNPAVRPQRALPEPRIASPCVANKIGGCVKPPRKVFDVKPTYPASLAASLIDGVVFLQGRVGIDGFMTDLRLAAGTDAPPHPDFVTAAMDAVRLWEFAPTYLNGVPVEANITITVRFNAAR
jgi:beta-lactamase regulating signal transducer with metallopeptidase domain